MKWIDAGDIKNWVTAKRRHCELSELLRRLIAASASTITRLQAATALRPTDGMTDHETHYRSGVVVG